MCQKANFKKINTYENFLIWEEQNINSGYLLQFSPFSLFSLMSWNYFYDLKKFVYMIIYTVQYKVNRFYWYL